MTYRPAAISSMGRTQSYVSPFTALTVPVAAPAAGQIAAQYSVYAYPLDVPAAAVADKLWVAINDLRNFNGVAYGGGTWVAVGQSGLLASSTDGTAWSQRTSGVTTALNGVAYGGGTWVAVGASGVIRTVASPAGAWSAPVSAGFSSTEVRGVAYGGGTWVAVGLSGTLRYTTNAAGTWTAGTPNASTNTLQGVAYGGGTWVAVGASGVIRYASDPTAAWGTPASGGFGSNVVNGVAYGGGTWVAVGASGVIRYASDPAGTWSAATASGFGTNAVNGVAYGGGTWVAVGLSNPVRTATDAAGTWSAASSPGFTLNSTLSVAYDETSRWVVGGYVGEIRTTTTAAGTWTGSVNETCEMGIYRADGSLVTSGEITLAGVGGQGLRYADITDVQLAPGSYYIAFWTSDPGSVLFYRTSSTTARLRARYVQSGQTSLPSTLTLAQETTGLVYLFGFTTK